MGTKTLGNTGAPNTSNTASWQFSGQNIMGGGTFQMPENGYIDSIAIWCSSAGSLSTFQHVLWDPPTGFVINNTGTQNFNGNYAYKTIGFAQANYVYLGSGAQFHTGTSVASPGVNMQFYSTGNHYSKTGTNGPVGMSGAIVNQFVAGDTNSYISYFPVATLTGFSPSVGGAGTTVTLTGRSYSAGVTGVSFNGTGASFNYVNDTTVTAVVPAGATTGTITITTYAGNATSGGAFTVAGAYVMRSGTWTPTQGVFVARSGVWTQVSGVFVARSGVWTSTG